MHFTIRAVKKIEIFGVLPYSSCLKDPMVEISKMSFESILQRHIL